MSFDSYSSAGKSYEETYESMPPRLERKPITKGRDLGRRKSKEETSSSSDSARAPSLPVSQLEGEDEEEIEFSMGKLIRQASLKTSDLTRFAAMGETATSRKKQEFDSLKLERLRPRREMSQLKTQKSLSDLQLQGIRDVGFKTTEDSAARKDEEADIKAQIKFWARAVASNVR